MSHAANAKMSKLKSYAVHVTFVICVRTCVYICMYVHIPDVQEGVGQCGAGRQFNYRFGLKGALNSWKFLPTIVKATCQNFYANIHTYVCTYIHTYITYIYMYVQVYVYLIWGFFVGTDRRLARDFQLVGKKKLKKSYWQSAHELVVRQWPNFVI